MGQHFLSASGQHGRKAMQIVGFRQDWLSDCGDPGSYLLQPPGTCEVWANISVFVEVCRWKKGVGRDSTKIYKDVND